MRRSPLSSTTVSRHCARGVLGLVAFVAAFAGLAAGAPPAIFLLLLAALAWRGCPTCWAIGLTQTRAQTCSRCD